MPATPSSFVADPVSFVPDSFTEDAPVDMRPRNYGTDTTGRGFWAHAGKTISSLPDAFLSGRIVTAPLESIGQSMQNYLDNPTFHNSIRAIPGVGMAEDWLTTPYRTAASGDIPGAFGDVVDMAGQIAVPELMRSLPSELPGAARPLAGAKGAAKGAWQGGTEMTPLTHGALPKLLGLPEVRMPAVITRAVQGAGAGRVIGGEGGEIAGGAIGAVTPIIRGAVKGARQGLKDYDFHQDFLNRQTPDYSGYSASTARPDVNQYSAPPPTSPMPANLTSLPESTSPRAFAGESPDQFAARLQAERYPGLSLPSVNTSSTPSGSFGVGLPPGFNPVTPSPTAINPISLPEGVNPAVVQMSPGEVQAVLHQQRYPGTAGPTAASARPDARFTPGQYDAPMPAITPINAASLPEGVNPARPITVPSPEDLAKVTLPDWLTPKTPVKAGKQPVTPSAAPPFNLIRQTDARDALEGAGGGVGPGIPVYRVPLSKVVGHEDISGDAAKAADISRYADMLKSGSEAPASFGHYDPKTGNVNLTSGSRRLAAAKQVGATDFHVAIPDGAPAAGKGIVPIAPYKAAAAPGSPVTIQAIPINSPAGIPDAIANRYAEVGGKHADIRALNTHNKNMDIAQHLADKGVQDVNGLSDDQLNNYIKDVNAKTGNSYKPMGAGSKGKGEGRTSEQQRMDLNLYLQHLRGELK